MTTLSKADNILKVYLKLIVKYNAYPKRADMAKAGISRDMIRRYFISLTNLRAKAEKLEPEVFVKLNTPVKPHEHEDFTKESLGSIIKDNDYQDGTFFVTAASPTSHLDWSAAETIRAAQGKDVETSNLFKPGFDAIKNFLERNNAELVILPMPAHVKALQSQPQHYDPALKEYKECFATEFTFNSHLKAIEAHLNPQQINPLTGLKRLRIHKYADNYVPGQEIKRFKTSVIVAHSKQMMEVMPTGNDSFPRLIHSTGSITLPSYLRNRIGMIANEDHKLGGLIVEIKGSTFWLRQVQFNKQDGSFIDLGQRYHANGKVTAERAEAFKMGDIHPGHHDEEALQAMYKLWDIIQPKRIFFEDFFDGSSISHHLANKRLTKAKLPNQFSDLPTEINVAKATLQGIWNHAPKDAELFATASNHPEHVNKYLEEGRYLNDCAANYAMAHRMVVMSLDGKNPLKEYLDPTSKMNWTEENQDIFIEGVQMNAHGHLGINGTRGSKIGHELSYGDAMVAHSHTPSIYHDTFTVGHMTHPRHGYNNGPSSWILCNGAVYKGGHKQLYMIIKGNAFKPRKTKATRG